MAVGTISSPASWVNGTVAPPTWFGNVQDCINFFLGTNYAENGGGSRGGLQVAVPQLSGKLATINWTSISVGSVASGAASGPQDATLHVPCPTIRLATCSTNQPGVFASVTATTSTTVTVNAWNATGGALTTTVYVLCFGY